VKYPSKRQCEKQPAMQLAMPGRLKVPLLLYPVPYARTRRMCTELL
jgi:hypothetical protein